MSTPASPNQDQIALWNSSAGQAWTESRELMDQMLRPYEELLVEVVAAGPCTRVLDVGCGTGTTTLALAQRLAPRAECTGIDISRPMLELARARAEREPSPPSFVLADAQTHDFAPASFDVIVSRFGVMFFDEPVRAFTNLRGAARLDARLALVAWRSAAENPFMTAAERAAAPFLPELPARRPNDPGQFAFADADRVRGILQESGWSEIEVGAVDRTCSVPASDLTHYVTRFGPVGRILQQADRGTQTRVLESVIGAMEPYIHGSEVRFSGACWLVQARANALRP